jgi:hypothetical protein
MTQKCHARESGHPDLTVRAGALDSRFRGNDTTLKDLILNDAHDHASNPRAAVRRSGLLAPRMLWPLDCFVARAPRNDGWAADPIDSVVIGRRLTADPDRLTETERTCKQPL